MGHEMQVNFHKLYTFSDNIHLFPNFITIRLCPPQECWQICNDPVGAGLQPARQNWGAIWDSPLWLSQKITGRVSDPPLLFGHLSRGHRRAGSRPRRSGGDYCRADDDAVNVDLWNRISYVPFRYCVGGVMTPPYEGRCLPHRYEKPSPRGEGGTACRDG